MTPRDRRALVWGGVTVAVAAVLVRGVPVLVRWELGLRATLRDRAELVARADRALQDAGPMADSAKAVAAAFVALAPKVLAGGTDAEALADLQGRVTLAAHHHRARVLRTDPVTDSTTVARLGRVRLRVSLESDWSGLVGVLGALDQDPAALRFGRLAVAAADPASSSAVPEQLRLDVEVGGWFVRADSTRGAP